MNGMTSSGSGTAALGALALLLALCLLVPAAAVAETGDQVEAAKVLHPGAQFWNQVRGREPLPSPSTQVAGVESAMFMNSTGERWRQFRMEQLIPVAGIAILAAIVLIALFYFVRGKVMIEGGPSDRKLARYTAYERTLHWFIASMFIFLAATGLILLFGRSVLLPLLGPELFSLVASASKEGHNLFGPVFGLALVLIFLKFVTRNIYARGDLTWLLKGGGVVGKIHVPPSGFFNMGEKSMFWLLFFVGGGLVATGLILVMPYFGQGREIMGLAHVVHALSALLLVLVIFGHVYIGTIGMEGAVEGMATGYCDLNWAKEHHHNWAVEVEDQAIPNEEVARMRGIRPRRSGERGAAAQEV